MGTSKSANGYQCTFVDKVPDDFYCKKCGLVARQVSVTSCCGESYCRACIEVEKGKPCPQCGSSSFTSMEQVKHQARIQKLQVFCSMKKRGCNWSGSLQLLESHLVPHVGNCEYVDIRCPLGCPKTLPRLKVQEHTTTECQKRLCACNLCGFQGTFEELTIKHTLYCEQLPVLCPNLCGIILKRSVLEDHRKVCPRENLECSFNKLGCTEKCTRAEKEEHFKSNHMKHLELAAEVINGLQEASNKKAETKTVKELNKRLQEMEEKFKQQNQQMEEQNTRLQRLEKLLGDHNKGLVKPSDSLGVKTSRSKSEPEEDMMSITECNIKREVPSASIKSEEDCESSKVKSEMKIPKIFESTVQACVNYEEKENKPDIVSSPHDEKPGVIIVEDKSAPHKLYVSNFTLENFTKEIAKDEPNKLETPPMYTHKRGYKFSIGIDANGFGSSRGKAMRVWMKSLPGEYDDQLQWPAEVTFRLELIGNTGAKNWIVSAVKTWLKPTLTSVVYQSFSYSPTEEYVFINHCRLSDYLSGDALRVNIAPAYVPPQPST